ncbi:MAG: RNA polymerase factor sigma-54 [Hyphomicrobium sp.]
MAFSAKLELRQGQQLVMTPQLQQAIRLLQLSNFELVEFVEAELERNPLLEREDQGEAAAKDSSGIDDSSPADSRSAENGAAENGHDGVRDGGAEGDSDGDLFNGSDDQRGDEWLDLAKPGGDAASALDTDLGNVFPDTAPAELGASGDLAGWATLRQRSSSFDDDDTNLESYVASERSLKDHLTEQLPLALSGHAERLIGQYLIDLVDEAGYLHADLDQMAEKLGATRSMIDAVVTALQSLDPPGVFARTLAECLALQLKERNRYDPQIAALLDNLHLLAAHNVAGLRKAVGVDMDELVAMIDEIKRLDPKPGLRYGTTQVHTVVPDILVRPAADGSWLVELNSENLPRVLVNRSYYTLVSKTARSDKDKGYLLECLQTANWLVKSLDQRARTILRVSEEIVRQQDGFFTHGVQHLRPLNLKTVADAISMHESTVSRVTSNKYMATPRGIFELKYFFTSAIQSAADGEAHSSEAVRHRIRLMIDGESSREVLSDDRIVEKLKADGVDIARRTVAKYREAMRIPSSVQRRREKRMAGQLDRPA